MQASATLKAADSTGFQAEEPDVSKDKGRESDWSKEKQKEAKTVRKFSLFKRSKSPVSGSEEPSSPTTKSLSVASSSALTSTQKHSSSSVTFSAWDVSDHLLTTLVNMAQYAPAPVGALASVAHSIFTAIQGTRDNKDALNQLATLVYSLIMTVINTQKDLQSSAEYPQSTEQSTSYSNDPVLNRHVENLLSKLEEIKVFVENHASRHVLRRVVTSKSDLGVIQHYKDQLKNTLDAFSLQSSITLRKTMSKVASQQETMLRSQECVRSTIGSLHQDVLKLSQVQTEESVRSTIGSLHQDVPKPKLSQDQTEQTQAEVQSITGDMSTLSLQSPVSKSKTVSFAPSAKPSPSHDLEFGERVDSPIVAGSPTGSDSHGFVFPPPSSPLSSSRASPAVNSGPSFQSTNPFLNRGSSFPLPPLSGSQSVPELSASERQESTSSFHNALANASIRGNISINHVAGNSTQTTIIDHSRSENFGNVYGIIKSGYDWRKLGAEAFGRGRGSDRSRQRGSGPRHGTGSMSVRGSGSVDSDFYRPTSPGAHTDQRRGRLQGYSRGLSSALTLRQGRSRTMSPGPGVRNYQFAELDHDMVGNPYNDLHDQSYG